MTPDVLPDLFCLTDATSNDILPPAASSQDSVSDDCARFSVTARNTAQMMAHATTSDAVRARESRSDPCPSMTLRMRWGSRGPGMATPIGSTRNRARILCVRRFIFVSSHVKNEVKGCPRKNQGGSTKAKSTSKNAVEKRAQKPHAPFTCSGQDGGRYY